MLLLFIQLFYTFFKIGLFGFGGGYAMLSLIQGEVVTKYHWLSSGEFTDIVAISQMTPGPIGINSATYVGYSSVVNAGYAPVWGLLGSFTATFAVVFPSFVLMLLISKFLMRYKSHPAVESVFQGLRPTVVGLLAAAVLLLLTPENFGTFETPWQLGISCFLFACTLIGNRLFKINPITLILFCGLAGLLLF